MAVNNKAELLSPAGDMERLVMALTYGADAVYLAGRQFGMRAAAGNFGDAELEKAVSMAHGAGARVYVTCNNVMRNDDMPVLPSFLETLADIGADGIICTDFGVLSLAKKYAPQVPVHISTQAGVANYETAAAFHELGAARVILARELPLDEIAEIRAKTPRGLELEAFVHGSMCVSFSGRCLLSDYLASRDANKGECAQPCRWKYRLVEEKRPGEYLEITEDGGTYILNSRDLCMIDHVGELIKAGIGSLKIEGRMKSAYYAAVVTNAYRRAIDAAAAGEPLKDIWRREVMKVSHREYSTGFYFDKNGPGEYYKDAMYFSDCDVAAVVESCDGEGNAVLTQRNKIKAGDRLELLTPTDEPVGFTAGELRNSGDETIDATPHPMMVFKMKLPKYAPANSLLRRLK